MSIETVVNPVTGMEVTLAKGIVERLAFKAIEGDKYGATHKVGIKIAGQTDWVNNISVKTKDGYDPSLRVNTGNNANPVWQAIEVGDEVRIELSVSEGKDGKTYYNTSSSKINLVKKGEGQPAGTPAQGQGAKKTYAKRDNTGVSIGHSLNGALNLVRSVEGLEYDEATVIALAQTVHKVTTDLKEVYAKKYPDMSEYDVGASVGNSVLNATRDVGEATETAIREHSEWLLNDVVPSISTFVQSYGKEEEKVETKKPAAKKTVAKKTVAKKATPAPTPETETPETPAFDPDDQDVPF